MYSSEALSKFTLFCNYRHHLSVCRTYLFIFPEVSETIRRSFHSFYFILLFVKLFLLFYLAAHWFVLLLWIFCYWFLLEYFSEKAMATHSSTLAWKIPWMEGPGRLQSMGSLGVGHNWATSISLFTFLHWRRKWQPTPVFLPGESQGQRSLVGCRLWGRTESGTTEVT